MKENALYHLMQLRARQLQESMSPEQRAVLAEIQQSLKIERSKGNYRLRWCVGENEYCYQSDSDNFVFYMKGDSNKKPSAVQDGNNYRRANWRSAFSLWREIYKRSGLDNNILQDSEELAFVKIRQPYRHSPLYSDVIVATIIAASALIFYTITECLQVAISTFVLLRLASCFETVHLRQQVFLFEKFVIGLGTIVPVWLGSELTGLIPLILALYLNCIGERSGKVYWFIAGGVMFGLAIPYLRWTGATTFICLLVLMLLLNLVDKHRLKLGWVLLMAFAFLMALLLVVVLVDIKAILIPGITYPLPHAEIIYSLMLVMLLLGGLAAAAWWISGVQYYLMPWFVLISLVVGQFVLFVNDNMTEISVLTATSGLMVFFIFRMLSGFIPGKLPIGQK